jgi:hypothetical protein
MSSGSACATSDRKTPVPFCGFAAVPQGGARAALHAQRSALISRGMQACSRHSFGSDGCMCV